MMKEGSGTARLIASKWTWSDVLLFEVLICGISLVFSIVGSVAPQIVLTIPKNGLAIGSNTVLLLAASLVPALVLLVGSAECRSGVLRFVADPKIYLISLLIGFALPFASYIGSAHSYPLWDEGTGLTLVRVFFINLLLSPLWEEVIWRAYFYPKVGSLLTMPHALLVTAVAWTVWHAGFLFYLHHFGVLNSALTILVIQFFFVGVIQCSIFTLSGNSLLPCVLLHAAFNASTAAYYARYDRAADVGSYIAEALAMLFVAAALFRVVIRRDARLRSTVQSL